MSATAHQARRRKALAARKRDEAREEQVALAGKELKAAYDSVGENGALPSEALNAAVTLEQIMENPTLKGDDIEQARKVFAVVMAETELAGALEPKHLFPDLTDINGIGPAKASKLKENGIADLEALANASSEQIEVLSIDDGWIAEAKALIEGGE
nr:helix-hairpin-helix domain-containing protein [uncultured Cohaesibacter sp.]